MDGEVGKRKYGVTNRMKRKDPDRWRIKINRRIDGK